MLSANPILESYFGPVPKEGKCRILVNRPALYGMGIKRRYVVDPYAFRSEFFGHFGDKCSATTMTNQMYG